jgi:DNA-directed RNA polymerase subunit M/transcription elongation factor TFIIS
VILWFLVVFWEFCYLVYHSCNFNSFIDIIKIMVKEKIDQRYCEDCGEIIWNRRADAKRCLECRRKAEREASKRVKEIEKRERILRKVKITGVKFEIEEEKIKGILDNLKQDPEEGFDKEKVGHTFSQEFLERLSKTSGNQIEKKIKYSEEKEKRKFLSFQ